MLEQVYIFPPLNTAEQHEKHEPPLELDSRIMKTTSFQFT